MRAAPLVPLIALIAPCLLAPLPAQRGDGKDPPGTVQAPPPASLSIPPAPPRTPEQEHATFTLPPGYRVELAAAEPLVEAPVAIAFDASERMWVVEMRSFMPDVDGHGEDAPSGRIAVLRDVDGDGRMDERREFLDGLVLPRAVLPLEDGALVLAPPHFLFCRDTDGDGRADTREVLGETFDSGLDNPEHAANTPTLGLDNWIHFARYHLRLLRVAGRWEWQRVAAAGQWGLTQDLQGRWFFNTNSDVLRCHLAPPHYAARNRALPNPSFVNQGTARDQSVWPGRVTPGVNRGYQSGVLRADGTLAAFTAACGPSIYRGERMPELRGDAFVPEPAANLVRRAIVTPDGRAIRSRNAYERAEFWTSTDERFRPVFACGGPDGALYVVDMYRGVLQHRQFVTTFLRRQVVERGLEEPLHLGRIWRVVPDRPQPDRPQPDRPQPVGPRRGTLAEASSGELVQALASADGWRADTAQRLLRERSDRSALSTLRELASLGAEPMARARAMWVLDALGELERSQLSHALRDRDGFVRAQAVRLCEPRLRARPDPILVGTLGRLVLDPDPGVRLQLALTLGEVASADVALRDDADLALAELLRREAGDRHVRDAVLSGLGGRELAFLAVLCREEAWGADAPPLRAFVRELGACALRGGDPHSRAALVDAAAGDLVRWRGEALLQGAADALPRPGARRVRIAGRPAGLATLAALDDPTVRSALRRFEESAEWAESAGRRVLEPEVEASLLRGRALYARECTACHQADGRGLDGLAPPLDGSEWVLGSEQRLIRIVLHGVQGPIEVDGRRYELAPMPDHGRLSDQEVADVLTFLRMGFENDAAQVVSATVARVREEEEGRVVPWTAVELLRW